MNSLAVIDAIRGFTTEGTFGKAFGKQDVVPIDQAFQRLQNFLDAAGMHINGAKCAVRSVYSAGKFTQDESSPLFRLCVEGSDDLDDALALKGAWHRVQKSENDATAEDDFRHWLEHEVVRKKSPDIVLAGCTLTTCIKKTGISTRRILNEANEEAIQVIVPMDFIGSRASHGKKIEGGKSSIDLVVEELRDSGILVRWTLP